MAKKKKKSQMPRTAKRGVGQVVSDANGQVNVAETYAKAFGVTPKQGNGIGDAIHNKGEAMAQHAQESGMDAPTQAPTDIAARQQAVQRLSKAMHYMGQPPESLLELLERLEIPWERIKNVPGDESYDTLVIKWSDFLDGERRNQEQGSVLKRLYGQDVSDSSAAMSDDQKFAMAMEKLGRIQRESGAMGMGGMQ